MNSQETFEQIELPVMSETCEGSLIEQCQKLNQIEKQEIKNKEELDKINGVIEILEDIKKRYTNKNISPEDVPILNLTIEACVKNLKKYKPKSKIALSKENFGGVQTLEDGTEQAIKSLEEEILEIKNYKEEVLKNNIKSVLSDKVVPLNDLRILLKNNLEKLKVKFLETDNFDNRELIVNSTETPILRYLTYILKSKNVIKNADSIKVESSTIIDSLKKYEDSSNEFLNFKNIIFLLEEAIALAKIKNEVIEPLYETEESLLESFNKSMYILHEKIINFAKTNFEADTISKYGLALLIKSSISDNLLEMCIPDKNRINDTIVSELMLDKNVEFNSLSKEQIQYIFLTIESFIFNEDNLIKYINLIKNDSGEKLYYLGILFNKIYQYQLNVCIGLYYLIKLSLEV